MSVYSRKKMWRRWLSECILVFDFQTNNGRRLRMQSWMKFFRRTFAGSRWSIFLGLKLSFWWRICKNLGVQMIFYSTYIFLFNRCTIVWLNAVLVIKRYFLIFLYILTFSNLLAFYYLKNETFTDSLKQRSFLLGKVLFILLCVITNLFREKLNW